MCKLQLTKPSTLHRWQMFYRIGSGMCSPLFCFLIYGSNVHDAILPSVSFLIPSLITTPSTVFGPAYLSVFPSVTFVFCVWYFWFLWSPGYLRSG